MDFRELVGRRRCFSLNQFRRCFESSRKERAEFTRSNRESFIKDHVAIVALLKSGRLDLASPVAAL